MFSLTLILSVLVVGCFDAARSIEVEIKETPPIEFSVNTKKNVTCVVKNAQQPIKYQWMIIGKEANDTLKDSNKSNYTFLFAFPQSGYIVCQAQSKSDQRFYNSTMAAYHVPLESLKKVWIEEKSPIHFKVNRTETLTCKTKGFSHQPNSYKWVDVRNARVIGVFQTSTAQLTFHDRVKNGSMHCLALDSLDSSEAIYVPSAYVSYQVNGQMSDRINTIFLSVMIVFALTFSMSQKIG